MAQETAQARHGAYRLLSELYLAGVSAELLLNRFNTPDIPCQHRTLPYTFASRDTTAPLEASD